LEAFLIFMIFNLDYFDNLAISRSNFHLELKKSYQSIENFFLYKNYSKKY
jgi:hypothetical protein